MNISEIQKALDEIQAERDQLMKGPNEADIQEKLARYEADLRRNFAAQRETKLAQLNDELKGLKSIISRSKFQS